MATANWFQVECASTAGVAVVNLAPMGLFNGVGVVFAALSVVLLVKHGFDMGTFAAPLDLALTYYEDVTRVLVGWIAPLAQRAAALAGIELSFEPHWKHFFLLTLLYCGAWTRASGGEKGSRVFDAVWGVVLALAAGLAAGLVPVAPGADGAADAILLAAFPIAAVLLFDIGDSIWLRFSVRVLMKVRTDVPWWAEVLTFSRTGITFALIGFGAVAVGILVSGTAFVRALPAPGLVLLVVLAMAAAVAVIAKAAREARTGGRIAAENDPARDARAEARAIFHRDPLRRFGVNILAALGGAAAFIAANAGLGLRFGQSESELRVKPIEFVRRHRNFDVALALACVKSDVEQQMRMRRWNSLSVC